MAAAINISKMIYAGIGSLYFLMETLDTLLF